MVVSFLPKEKEGKLLSLLVQAGHEGSDVAISVREILTQATQWQQFARTIKRRLPTDGSAGPVNLSTEVGFVRSKI